MRRALSVLATGIVNPARRPGALRPNRAVAENLYAT